jgi:hypothetical protein
VGEHISCVGRVEMTTTIVVPERLKNVLTRLAKGRSLEQCLIEELRGGLKAKTSFYRKLLLEFEEKYGMGYEEAAKRFEKGEVGDSYIEHEAYLEFLFLKDAVKELNEIEEALRTFEEPK